MSLLEVEVKQVNEHMGKGGSGWTHVLYLKVTDMPRWRVIEQPYHAQVFVTRWPSNKVKVGKRAQYTPNVMIMSGPASGMRILDRESMLAALAEVGFHWLNAGMNWRLRPPEISRKVIGDTDMDSCLSCRWCRMLRFGTEELALNMGVDEEDGPCVRDLPKDMYESVIQPQYHCTLFGHFPEEEFGVLAELNELAQGGMCGRPQMMNWKAGTGQEAWLPLDVLRTRMMQGKACMYQRQNGDGFRHRQPQQMTLDGLGPGKKQYGNTEPWEDVIPTLWMPADEDGIHVTAGVRVWSPQIGRSPVWCRKKLQEVPHVRTRMQPEKEPDKIRIVTVPDIEPAAGTRAALDVWIPRKGAGTCGQNS